MKKLRWKWPRASKPRRGDQLTDDALTSPTESPQDLAPTSDQTVEDSAALVAELLAQDRYALLLRARLAANLDEEQFARARQALEERMTLVPEGMVDVASYWFQNADQDDDDEAAATLAVYTAPFYLDRHVVTNRRYREFVLAKGYEQMSIWDAHVWPAVLDFVDQGGHPGPRFWVDGGYAPGEDDLPVVGVSWFEAAAYARWVGKRLPTDAEWVKAGVWPVPISADRRCQRRFPWGDSMDLARCNLWSSAVGKMLPVDAFPNGASVGGARQLIGNVWEWTSGDFSGRSPRGRELSLPCPMKSVRGGAFDTYFESHATCQFQSGENPLARRHNIGFRLAIGMCDLSASQEEDSPERDESILETHSGSEGNET